MNEKIFIRGEIVHELPSGQKRVHILANNADGMYFYTDDSSILREIGNSWISVKDRLPEEGGEVLIYSTHCQTHGIYVASISKGISEAEREKMRKGELPDPPSWGWCRADGWTATPRSKVYKGCDEHGNNKVPYAWSHGPYNWNGQDVTHWMPLPKPPFIPEKKEETPKCDAKTLAEWSARLQKIAASIGVSSDSMPTFAQFKEAMTNLAKEKGDEE